MRGAERALSIWEYSCWFMLFATQIAITQQKKELQFPQFPFLSGTRDSFFGNSECAWGWAAGCGLGRIVVGIAATQEGARRPSGRVPPLFPSVHNSETRNKDPRKYPRRFPGPPPWWDLSTRIGRKYRASRRKVTARAYSLRRVYTYFVIS